MFHIPSLLVCGSDPPRGLQAAAVARRRALRGRGVGLDRASRVPPACRPPQDTRQFPTPSAAMESIDSMQTYGRPYEAMHAPTCMHIDVRAREAPPHAAPPPLAAVAARRACACRLIGEAAGDQQCKTNETIVGMGKGTMAPCATHPPRHAFTHAHAHAREIATRRRRRRAPRMRVQTHRRGRRRPAMQDQRNDRGHGQGHYGAVRDAPPPDTRSRTHTHTPAR